MYVQYGFVTDCHLSIIRYHGGIRNPVCSYESIEYMCLNR